MAGRGDLTLRFAQLRSICSGLRGVGFARRTRPFAPMSICWSSGRTIIACFEQSMKANCPMVIYDTRANKLSACSSPGFQNPQAPKRNGRVVASCDSKSQPLSRSSRSVGQASQSTRVNIDVVYIQADLHKDMYVNISNVVGRFRSVNATMWQRREPDTLTSLKRR